MIIPTQAEIATLKSDARKRFGGELALSCPMGDPIDACVVVAPFDLRTYSAHVDARERGLVSAQAAAVVDRLLWCSPPPAGWSPPRGAEPPYLGPVDALAASPDDPEPLRRVAIDRLEVLRSIWPAVDAEVEGELRKAAGDTRVLGHLWPKAVPLTPGSAPPGLPPTEAAELLAGAPKVGPGSLWAVTSSSGLALVLRAPQPGAWLAARAAFGEAHEMKAGIVESTLVLARQLVAWSPDPFDALIERTPGYAEALWKPLLDMGGSSAKTSSAFL